VRDNFRVVGQIGLFSRAQITSMRDRTKRRNYSEEAEEFRRDHARRRRYGLAQRHAQKLTRLYGSPARAEAEIRREFEEARAARSRAREATPALPRPEALAAATTRPASVVQEGSESGHDRSAQAKSEHAAPEVSGSTRTGSAQPRPKPDGPAQPGPAQPGPAQPGPAQRRPDQARPAQTRPNPDGPTQSTPEANGFEHATQCEQTEPKQPEPDTSPHKQIGFEPLERALTETEPTGIGPVEHALTESKPAGPGCGRNPASPSDQSGPDRIRNRSGNAGRRQQRRLRPGSTKRHPGAARKRVRRPESARHIQPAKGTRPSNRQARRNSSGSGLGAAHQRSRKPLPAYLGRTTSPRPEGCREHVPP
jgi:hypothetical protein